MIELLSDTVDLQINDIAKYWVEKLGVSRSGLERAIQVVGTSSKKLKKHFEDGYRIAIRGDNGIGYLVARVMILSDGFGVLVPYHPEKRGWIYELPLDYSKKEYMVQLKSGKHFIVTDRVKLSCHMTGFVKKKLFQVTVRQ